METNGFKTDPKEADFRGVSAFRVEFVVIAVIELVCCAGKKFYRRDNRSET